MKPTKIQNSSQPLTAAHLRIVFTELDAGHSLAVRLLKLPQTLPAVHLPDVDVA